MIDTLIPILYFIAVFGFFEAVLFRNRIDYWHRPVTITLYFLLATAGVLIFFSAEPLWLVVHARVLEYMVFMVLVLALVVAVLQDRFAYEQGGGGSLRYVVAKSADILFQDTLAILVALGLGAWLGTSVALGFFALYFFCVHLFLLFLLPARYGVVFVLGSLVAGVLFGTIILYDVGVVYVFVLHWLFYILLFPTIRSLRIQLPLRRIL